MWERDRVQELYLDQRIFVVYVKIEIYCDVEDYDQAEDHDVRAEGFNFLDQEDGQQWDQYFKNLEINRSNFATCSVWSFLGFVAVQGWRNAVIAFNDLVEYLEHCYDPIERGGCPD